MVLLSSSTAARPSMTHRRPTILFNPSFTFEITVLLLLSEYSLGFKVSLVLKLVATIVDVLLFLACGVLKLVCRAVDGCTGTSLAKDRVVAVHHVG